MSLIFDLEEADARRLFLQPAPRPHPTLMPLAKSRSSRGHGAQISKKTKPPHAGSCDSETALTPRPYEPRRFRRWVPRRSRRLWIEPDTAIVPLILADVVCDEVSSWLGEDKLPRSWKIRLAVKADVVYHHNRRFRQGVRRSGWRGVDYLRMFMRHWLAARLHRHRPDWYARLPSDFCRGADLPEPARVKTG